MQPTGDRVESTTGPSTWQAPLEADPADAQEQTRDVVDVDHDPEAPLATASDPEAPLAAAVRLDDLDLTRASEADLAEQLYEVPFDDDGER